MNEQIKASGYANIQDLDMVKKMPWNSMRSAFIAGSKSGYSAGVKSGLEIGVKTAIEDVEYNADQYVPEKDGSCVASHYVVCVDTNKNVYYDYDESLWFNNMGEPAAVTTWRYPKPVAIEQENEVNTGIDLKDVFKEYDIEELLDYWRNNE